MYGFTLNHQTTSTSLGLRLTAPVSMPASIRAVDDIEVEGRAGTLTRFTGWRDSEIDLELAIRLDGGLGAFATAAHALINASTIAFSGEPGVFRLVKHVHVEPLKRESAGWGFFTATLTCQPFSYLDSGLNPITLTTTGTVTNPGLLDADPIITLTGTGTLALTVNGIVHQVRSPSGQVTLDSARLVAHVSGKVASDALTGPFPVLTPGVNQIKLGTGISKIVVVPNWRNP